MIKDNPVNFNTMSITCPYFIISSLAGLSDNTDEIITDVFSFVKNIQV